MNQLTILMQYPGQRSNRNNAWKTLSLVRYAITENALAFQIDADNAVKIAGEAPEHFEQAFDDVCKLPFVSRYARFTQMALLGTAFALEDSGLDLEKEETR